MKKYTIGGSEIASICGLNKYRTPFQVFVDKTSDKLSEGNKFTSAGEILEPIILQQFSDTNNIKLHRHQERFYHTNESFLCKVDAISTDNRFIISAKNTSQEVDPYNLPDYWTHQINWEMGLSGIHEGYITWLSRGNEFNRAKITFDSELFDWQLQMANQFIFCLENNQPPPPMNAIEIVQRINAESKPKELDNEELYVKIGKLKNLQVTVKECEKEIEEIKEEIKMFMVECDTLTHGSSILATWKQNKSGYDFDKKELEATYPEIYQQFLIEKKGNRVLLVK